VKVAVSTGDGFGVLDLQVEVLGGAIGYVSVGESGEVVVPPVGERGTEPGDFGRGAVQCGGDHSRGGGPVAGVVTVHQILGDGPGGVDLTGWVAGGEALTQPLPGTFGQAIGAAAQQAANAVERISSPAAMPVLFLLDTAAHIVHHDIQQAGRATGREIGDTGHVQGRMGAGGPQVRGLVALEHNANGSDQLAVSA
jgi:hypothetical protein